MDRLREEEEDPVKLQKHMRDLSEQLYRNVSVPPGPAPSAQTCSTTWKHSSCTRSLQFST